MKNNKTLILDVTDSYEEFFEDAIIIGIVTSHKSYKFCLRLNKTLNFDFRLNTDIVIELKKKQRTYHFPVYQSDVVHSHVKHYLYDNRHDGEVLLPEFKNIDFIWLVKGDINYYNQLQDLLHIINSMDGIQLASEIPHSELPNREYLIF
ncbi:MAG: IPExxxVDY family protein [Arachidicoccus sp.]|nr:IPExxxVDY family protein [Arachidicoccus sp.]